jgi:flavorubredoxin
MSNGFKAEKITDNVYWVGAIDWNVRDFHGYATHTGTTYNAFLVMADRVTLIDTVKKPFKDEMFARIRSVIDPGTIDYVISNHSEMDHSGSLPDTIDLVRPEKVFASVMGAKALREHFHMDSEIIAVEDGGSIDLGNTNINCYETRMLHWPDSMFTYLAGEKLLFSQDAFGMHLASYERFDDELDGSVLEHEAAKYFANILTLYSKQILKLLEKVPELGIDIDLIAPDHGPIWRSNQGRILELYRQWAERRITNKAVVVYDTMWGSTDLMARAIGDGLSEAGTNTKVMKLRAAHRSDIATELLDAGALIVGSPTLNNTVFPTMADALTYCKGLRFTGLVGAAFGSYGWGGGAVKQLEELLRGMKVEIVTEGLQVKYVPDGEALDRCREFGRTIAGRLKELPKQ